MSGYMEVTVVVDGALEDTRNIVLQDALDAFINVVGAEAAEDGLPTEVYILYHEHADDGEECLCVQYLTDYSPAYTFNVYAPRTTHLGACPKCGVEMEDDGEGYSECPNCQTIS